jgi:hypothetical protein
MTVRVDSSARILGRDALTAQAVEAWLELGLGGMPTEVTVLKEAHRKSTVLRLHDAVSSGSAVIAKYCPFGVASVERAIYEHVLPALPVSALRLFGASEEAEGRAWLFLEDAGDVVWVPDLAEHRRLATEWLAAAHLAATVMVDRVELPLRAGDYYRGMLHGAQATLGQALGNDAIDSDGRALLARILGRCARLDADWGLVESLLRRLPATLTLPGFGKKNVRVRSEPTGDTILPLDFESAGWGPPAADLRNVDVPAYARAVGSAFQVDERDVETLAVLGDGLAAFKSIPGEAPALLSPWPKYVLRKLSHYDASLESALEAAGLEAGPA